MLDEPLGRQFLEHPQLMGQAFSYRCIDAGVGGKKTQSNRLFSPLLDGFEEYGGTPFMNDFENSVAVNAGQSVRDFTAAVRTDLY